MGAGSKVSLDLGGPVKIEVEQGAIDALIEQGGAIQAGGGYVYLTARAAGDLITTVINHSGVTEAQTLASGASGEIYLMGDMETGRIEVAGTLDASAPPLYADSPSVFPPDQYPQRNHQPPCWLHFWSWAVAQPIG